MAWTVDINFLIIEMWVYWTIRIMVAFDLIRISCFEMKSVFSFFHLFFLRNEYCVLLTKHNISLLWNEKYEKKITIVYGFLRIINYLWLETNNNATADRLSWPYLLFHFLSISYTTSATQLHVPIGSTPPLGSPSVTTCGALFWFSVREYSLLLSAFRSMNCWIFLSIGW